MIYLFQMSARQIMTAPLTNPASIKSAKILASKPPVVLVPSVKQNITLEYAIVQQGFKAIP